MEVIVPSGLAATALVCLDTWFNNHVTGGSLIEGSRRVSPAMQGEVNVVPPTFKASVDPDTFASQGVQVLPGGADREIALGSQGIRQYDIERHAAPAPFAPADLIGAAAAGCATYRWSSR